MARHDFVVEDDFFPNIRADLNAALLAIASTNSDTGTPSPSFPYQLYGRTDTASLNVINPSNTLGLEWATLSASTISLLSDTQSIESSGRQVVNTEMFRSLPIVFQRICTPNGAFFGAGNNNSLISFEAGISSETNPSLDIASPDTSVVGQTPGTNASIDLKSKGLVEIEFSTAIRRDDTTPGNIAVDVRLDIGGMQTPGISNVDSSSSSSPRASFTYNFTYEKRDSGTTTVVPLWRYNLDSSGTRSYTIESFWYKVKYVRVDA